MDNKNYLNDLKNLQPRPLDKIPMLKKDYKTRIIDLKTKQSTIIKHNSSINNPKSTNINHKSERSMERLNTSKTMWGFGIAIFLYIMQSMLVAFNIASPDNLILKTFIEVVIALSGFFGVYGVRDALRKMSL